MTYELRHKYKEKHKSPKHEYKGHGYSIQSGIQASSGGPGPVPGSSSYPMNRYDSEGDSGDYVLSATGKPARNKAEEKSDAGPAEKIATAANMWGRGFREDSPLMSHNGQVEIASDENLNEPVFKGFRWRARHDRV